MRRKERYHRQGQNFPSENIGRIPGVDAKNEEVKDPIIYRV